MMFMLQLSLIFSIYRSAALSNGIYVLLGLGLVGFLMIEVIMVSIYVLFYSQHLSFYLLLLKSC